MGVTYRLQGKVLRFEFKGGTPALDVYARFHSAYQTYNLPDDATILVDLRGSTSLASRTPEVVRMLSEFVIKHPARPGDKIAIMLPASEKARLEPLISEVADGSEVYVASFDDEKEALEWLGGESAGEG
jgi:hypothetical protein